jgi:broad specificity phosphatase PhoE
MIADVQRDKVVYFVLHGQSEDNVAPVFQSPDSPLSAVGRAQAARMAERVAKLAFQALLASPYTYCMSRRNFRSGMHLRVQ